LKFSVAINSEAVGLGRKSGSISSGADPALGDAGNNWNKSPF
jgi:hypothetical protein